MVKTINKVLNILLSISIIITGICMMVQCLSIYNSGDKPYTRASVAEAFTEIKIPIIIFISLLILSVIFDLLTTDLGTKSGISVNKQFVLNAINRKWDINALNDPAICKERRKRRTRNIISLILIALGFSVFAIYALNPANFHQSQINQSMVKAMTVFCLSVCVPFFYRIVSVFLNEKSIKREITLSQSLVKTAPKQTQNEVVEAKNTAVTVIKLAVVAISVAVILYGLFSGGTADVLTKAINICTECIGLG